MLNAAHVQYLYKLQAAVPEMKIHIFLSVGVVNKAPGGSTNGRRAASIL